MAPKHYPYAVAFQFVQASGFSSRAIGYFGRGGFSHVDCRLADGTLIGARSDVIRVGDRVISAGVQKRPPNYTPWVKQVVYEIPCSHLQYEIWSKFLDKCIGDDYDSDLIWDFALGIRAKFGYPRDWRMPGSWICSELATYSLEHCNIIAPVYNTPVVNPGTCAAIVSSHPRSIKTLDIGAFV